jgi:hypothetical protein
MVIISTKAEKLKWTCKSNKEILIPYSSGDISFMFDAIKSNGSVEHMGKKFTALLAGRPNQNK